VLLVMTVVGQGIRETVSRNSTSQPAIKPATLDTRTKDQEAWMGQALGELKALRNELDRVTKTQQEIDQKLQRYERQGLGAQELKLRTTKALPPGPPPSIRGIGEARAQPGGATVPPLPPAMGAAPASKPAEPLKSPTEFHLPLPSGPPAGGGLPQSVTPGGGSTPAQQTGDAAASPSAVATGGSRIKVFQPDETHETPPGKYWLPTGSIVPVQLLSGLDAPTRTVMAGVSGAHPVLMRVADYALMPNRTRMDLRECYALGEGVGDLSSERAMLRILGISCINRGGQAVELPVKGMVTGEDGKLGLRGRLVMKEGAMLFRALLSGFVAGISRAFMPFQQGFFIASTAGQALQPPDPQQVGLAGLAGGLGNAANVLARHYAMLARQIYPVIEVDAGRMGDLIVTEGRELAAAPK
jgi:conjugal transfer pilus assembly protein TraB